MHYAIFIPQKTSPNNDCLDELGLAGLHDGTGPMWVLLDNGPGGGSGMLASWLPSERQSIESYDASRQSWTEFDGYWIGVDKEHPPTSVDLVRENIHHGNAAILADDDGWMIPVVEFLPHRHGIDHSNGQHVRHIRDEYKSYADDVDKFANYMLSQLETVELLACDDERSKTILAQLKVNKVEDVRINVSVAEGWLFCVKALAMNYRVCEAVVDVLGLVGDTEMVRIVWSAMEIDQHLGEVVKKKRDSKIVGTSVASLI